jgi:hypothetical protein
VGVVPPTGIPRPISGEIHGQGKREGKGTLSRHNGGTGRQSSEIVTHSCIHPIFILGT